MSNKTLINYINEPLSKFLNSYDFKNALQKVLCCIPSSGGSIFLEAGDNISITGTGTEEDPYIISGDPGISGLTTNYITKATSATSIGNSLLYDNGTSVLLGTTTPDNTRQFLSDANTQVAIAGVSNTNYAGYFTNGNTAVVPTLYVQRNNTSANIAEFYGPTQSVKITADGSLILSSLASTVIGVDGTGKIVAATTQAPISLTTTGTSGAATFITNTLNIPRYDNAMWKLLGNTGTTYMTNFIGTIDNVNLGFKVNNTISGRIEGDATGHTSFGYNSMSGTLSSFNNSAFGYLAGRDITSAENNTLIGSMAGRSISTATGNTFTGFQAGLNNNGNQNTAIGNQIMRTNTSGINNSAIGHQALFSNTTGSYCSALGILSLYSNTTGGYNVGVGEECLFSNSTGFYNVAIGPQSLYNTTGQYNVGIGYQAGYNSSSGETNTFIGALAGSSKTTGDNNTVLGYNAQLPSNTGSNQLSIKNLIFGTGLTGSVASPAGNIGIGDVAPSTRLSVTGTSKSTNTYTTSNSPSISFGLGIGTDSTPTSFTLSGNNKGGVISFTPSTGPASNSTAFTVVFSNSFAYPNGCSVILRARNNPSIYAEFYTAGNTISFSMVIGDAALTEEVEYEFNYIVEGY